MAMLFILNANKIHENITKKHHKKMKYFISFFNILYTTRRNTIHYAIFICKMFINEMSATSEEDTTDCESIDSFFNKLKYEQDLINELTICTIYNNTNNNACNMCFNNLLNMPESKFVAYISFILNTYINEYVQILYDNYYIKNAVDQNIRLKYIKLWHVFLKVIREEFWTLLMNINTNLCVTNLFNYITKKYPHININTISKIDGFQLMIEFVIYLSNTNVQLYCLNTLKIIELYLLDEQQIYNAVDADNNNESIDFDFDFDFVKLMNDRVDYDISMDIQQWII